MEQPQSSNAVPPAAHPPAPAAPLEATPLVVQPNLPAPPAVTGPVTKPSAEQLREALKEVYDPEIPINVVDLGLIYKLEERDGVVEIEMTLTSPHCPIGDQIAAQVRETIRAQPGITAVNVKLTFDPLWTKELITADGRLQASMLGLM